MQIVVDDVLIKHDADLLTVLALGFVGLVLLSVTTKAVREYSSLYLVNQLNYNIGNRVLHHLIRLPMDYFEKRHMGDIVSRFSSIKPIQEFITGGLIAVLIDGLLAITTFSVMILYAPAMAGVVLASVSIYAVFRIVQFIPLRNASHENIAADAKLNSIFMESIRTLQGIKLAGKEIDRQNSWRNQFAASINTNAKIGRLTISYEAANNTLTGLEYVAVIYLGANFVLTNQMSVGMLYAFMAYRSNFSNSIISIINQFVQYRMLGLHLERLSDITETRKEEGLQTTSTLLLPVQGSLRVKGLGFSYAVSEPPIIANLDLQIEAGEMVALFGPSGAGKSTLLKILVGLLQPTTGELLIDGLSLDVLGQKTYRNNVAALMQDDSLFSGSLSENISFFDLVPDHERIQRVCKQVNVHDEILKTPMGYDSLIGDMGSSLSMGQQQRLLMARALYRKPKILFLDEGTAHVDALSEKTIMQNLKSLDITVVYVTHNESILEYADKTVIWNDQKIVVT
jgi:ATP-binding cassette subfamily B protein RaxB